MDRRGWCMDGCIPVSCFRSGAQKVVPTFHLYKCFGGAVVTLWVGGSAPWCRYRGGAVCRVGSARGLGFRGRGRPSSRRLLRCGSVAYRAASHRAFSFPTRVVERTKRFSHQYCSRVSRFCPSRATEKRERSSGYRSRWTCILCMVTETLLLRTLSVEWLVTHHSRIW